MPLFPVDSSVFAAVKARMQRARELDKLKLGARKKDVEKSWWRRAAEEAELELSESEDEDEAEWEGRGGKGRYTHDVRNLFGFLRDKLETFPCKILEKKQGQGLGKK